MIQDTLDKLERQGYKIESNTATPTAKTGDAFKSAQADMMIIRFEESGGLWKKTADNVTVYAIISIVGIITLS